eukprot:6181487-Pleurochrysis_carterae.AAC.2
MGGERRRERHKQRGGRTKGEGEKESKNEDGGRASTAGQPVCKCVLTCVAMGQITQRQRPSNHVIAFINLCSVTRASSSPTPHSKPPWPLLPQADAKLSLSFSRRLIPSKLELRTASKPFDICKKRVACNPALACPPWPRFQKT